ncbi:MAG: DUF4394 domain-containing protein [Pseudonocardiaceae bacterium]
MRKSLITLLAGTALLLPLSVACGSSAPAGDQGAPAPAGDRGQPALDIVGLTDDNKLVAFSSDNSTIRETGTIRGLSAGDTKLVGIDYRVQDGKLYGVGDKGGLYTLEINGQATSVGRLTIALEGTSFGVDFNPAANALRVVSDTGQNLRQSLANTPLAVTAADAKLSYPPVPPATAPAPPAAGIIGAAYTNNDADPNTATTLYDLDATLDQIVIQSPANSGLLAPTGKLTVDAGADAGFDIYSVPGGGTITGQLAFATLPVGGRYGLYKITLFSGKAELVGSFDRKVVDVAIPLNQS